MRGTLPDEQLEAALEALAEKRNAIVASLQGDGAIAQGRGAIAVGKGGVALRAERDLHVHPPAAGADPDALRRSYLSRLFQKVRPLSLSGIDPAAAAQEEGARLELDAVYTALLTRSGDPDDSAVDPERAVERGHLPRQRPLSALAQLDRHSHLVLLGEPGSGKSTFVDFVALCLAGAELGRQDANLELLRAPLARGGREETEPEPQPWGHGALLPVRVVLRDFAAWAGLPAPSEPGTAQHLLEFLRTELASAGLSEWKLERELRESGGLLLIDGLDEVPEAEKRRRQIKQVIEDFVASHPTCRVLVTSRTYAYQSQEWRLGGFTDAVLAPFNDEQIGLFIDRWYAHVSVQRGGSRDDSAGRAELLKRAIARPDRRLRSLAERPLLLTLMASLHAWREGDLPERRERLYADAVELLLHLWERRAVVRDPNGETRIIQPSLLEFLNLPKERMRTFLDRAAFEAHARQPEVVGTADLAESSLVEGLLELSPDPDCRPARLIEFLSDRAGLLLPRGVGVYTLPHRTFQEYLAACHLTGGEGEFPDEVARLARSDPQRWREVALLAAAKAGRGAASAVWDLVDALCFREPGDPEATPEDAWGAQLAGLILVESAELKTVHERNRRRLERVRQWLVAILRGAELPASERCLAGDSLARIGDPRPEITLDGMQFCLVPSGRFWMGSDLGDARDKPMHELELPYPCWVGRYPVTVAQFRQFEESAAYGEGFAEADQGEGIDVAALSEPFGLPNHPVVLIDWYRALAFCSWLSERWRSAGLLPEGWEVRLPSEAEWEKAARGGLQIPATPIVRTPGQLEAEYGACDNAEPQRESPWAGPFDEEHANTEESGLGATNAVGAFSRGASPYGCEEMSGNVWEWTRSRWGRDWKEPDFQYPYDPQDGRESLEAGEEVLRVLRGGSFVNYQGFARCSYRYGYFPNLRYGNYGFRVLLSPSSSDL